MTPYAAGPGYVIDDHPLAASLVPEMFFSTGNVEISAVPFSEANCIAIGADAGIHYDTELDKYLLYNCAESIDSYYYYNSSGENISSNTDIICLRVKNMSPNATLGYNGNSIKRACNIYNNYPINVGPGILSRILIVLKNGNAELPCEVLWAGAGYVGNQ